MKKYIRLLIICVTVFIVCNTANAEPRKHILIYKLGSYEIDNRTSNNYTIDQKSDSVYGFEYEYRFNFGLAIGAEYVHFNNNYNHPSFVRTQTLDTDVHLFNVKYIFDVGRFKPFAGIGVGRALSDCESIYTCDGDATQWLLGVNYEWDRIGMQLMYRKLTSKVDAEAYWFSTQTDEINISGDGISVGLIVKF